MSCSVFGETEELMNYEFQPAEEETDCNITIIHRTGEYLAAMFQEFDPDVAHFTLKFPNNSILKVKEEVIQPFKWIWTYSKNNRFVPFLRWRIDYGILSFGLLNTKALPKSFIVLAIEPPNCPITIGSRKSNLEIAYAFSNMSRKYLNSTDIKHDNWCYAAEVPGVKNTFLYKLGIHFGYPLDFVRYNCCYSNYHFVQGKLHVDCSHHQIKTMKDTTSGPYFLGLILFCYFPILLLGFGANMSGRGHESYNSISHVRNGYTSLDDQHNNENNNYEDNMTSDYIYLKKQSPITLGSIICEFCLQEKRQPQLASRLKRTIFIIICPILVYIKLIVYSSVSMQTTLELIKHGIPINFMTMLSGFEKSRELFVPILGGPYVLISLFYVLGIILVVLPKNLENVLEDGSLDFKWADKYPLTLGCDSVKYFSHTQIEEESGYGRLSMTMIFCAGFIYVAEIIVFLFIAVLVYPSTAFVYLFFGTALFYYFLKQLRKIGDVYHDLLSDIVELLIVREAEPTHARVVDGAIIVCNGLSETIHKIQINECTIELSQEHLQTIKASTTRVNDRMIHYNKNRVPGIPRELFLYVVNKHRPVFITVFKAFLHIGLIIILMTETLRITSYASRDSSQITEVMHVVFVVFIGSLPHTLEITFSSSNKALSKEIFMKQLELTIWEYNSKHLVEIHSPNEPDLENATNSF
ncbi:hypothetical protein CHS0354_039803 [Potamilus streckersoni]|uniref:Uncharacterized protein n=1 Tax=Potamilus streckersoni TaxID=2493646 RepID=A0AAE0W1A2_9BIVA|nr:hypothetical protein CHS0354_039803 [Potamilus streckersoni]